ncbi:MAG TPA: hypothetical protein VKT80_07665, partial [Chloroflexota bacterium]|nr:hypothetical protein [Chloroflexota bacterium]
DTFLAELIRRRPHFLIGYQMEWRDLARKGEIDLRAETARRQNQSESLSPEDKSDWLADRLDDARRFVQRHDPEAPR